jgi:outer membrane protein assembly factor BamB
MITIPTSQIPQAFSPSPAGPAMPTSMNLLTLMWIVSTAAQLSGFQALPETLTTAPAASVDTDSDWNEFLGGARQGLSPATGLPLRWNLQTNVAWKKAIAGTGHSSPVIVGNRLWLTTAIEKDGSLHLLCLNADTGDSLWDVMAFQPGDFRQIHRKNSHATPTPLVIGDRCIAHFGAHGTLATDLDGRVLWRKTIPYYHHHGPGSSPVVVDETLILVCDGHKESFYGTYTLPNVGAPQFVVGLDVTTGEERWRSVRDGQHSYATPLVIDVEGGKQVICPGGNGIVAYDPANGAELWSYQTQGYSVVPRPVFGQGLVFVCTGYDDPELVAIRPETRGEVSGDAVGWKSTQAVPLNPTPILVGDQLYTISDSGILCCFMARTGDLVWKRRVGGNYSASPVCAEGRLFLLNESGETTIVQVGDEYRLLARNPLSGTTLSSIAIAGNSLYIRTDSELFRIQQLQAEGDDAEAVSAKPKSIRESRPQEKPMDADGSESFPGIRLRGTKKKTDTSENPEPQ